MRTEPITQLARRHPPNRTARRGPGHGGPRVALSVFLAVVFLSLLALAGTAHAVTLVDDNGNPIGGQYQAWADEAQAATLSGALTIQFDGSPYDCPIACSSAPGMGILEPDGTIIYNPGGGPAITYLVPQISVSTNQWDLYWELGHQYDWQLLTSDQRAQLAALWQDPAGQWWDTQASLNQMTEDGLEAQFASDYAHCALGLPPETNPWTPQVVEPADPQEVCWTIDQDGLEDGAHEPALPPTITVAAVPRPAPEPARHRKHRRRRHRRRLAASSPSR